MTPLEIKVDDDFEIRNLLSQSQYLIDTCGVDELMSSIFLRDEPELQAETDFGFDRWRGEAEIRAGFEGSLARFEASAHLISNPFISINGDRASARYNVQGWHWVRTASETSGPRNCDFLVLGVMTDELLRTPAGWRVFRRKLVRIGPGVAIGTLPGFLDGLGIPSAP